MARTLFALTYRYVDDMIDRRGPHRDGHLALIERWYGDGRIVLAGALGSPPHGGLLVFDVAGPDQVQPFLDADPYYTAGLVVSHTLELLTAVAG